MNYIYNKEISIFIEEKKYKMKLFLLN